MNLLKLFILLVSLSCLHQCKPADPKGAAAKASASPRKPTASPVASGATLDTTFHTSFFKISYHEMPWPESTAARVLIQELELQATAVRHFWGVSEEKSPHFNAGLFPTLEAKGLQLGNTTPCQVDASTNSIYLIANNTFQTIYLGPQNALLIRRHAGKPATTLLETGLSIYFNKKWQKLGYNYWAVRLAHSGNLPPLSELLDESLQTKASPLVSGTAAAAFVDFLIQEWGKAHFMEEYLSWSPTPAEVQQLNSRWKAHLNAAAKETAPTAPTLPFLKGFNFAHEGYDIYNGYGSNLAKQALDEQAAIGANAVALVPYSYMRNPQAPSHLPFMSRAGTETDEGLIADHYHSRGKGLRTVLKPQIWLGHNSWPGAVEMNNEADWNAFFDYYYRWIRHYALLAAIHNMDMLCVGVEFAKTTTQQPQQWRQLIHKIKGIYHGPLTYAANWGEEFEKLAFWDELDYIGLNCYYPLSKAAQPTELMLEKAFQEVLKKAQQLSRQYNRPLLFTEIGFTSTTTPWIQPHEDGRGKEYAGEPQKMCYRIAMEKLQGQQDWCGGILWWKYPSYLQNGGPGHTGFTPNDKPAEAIVQKWFSRLP